MTAAYVNLLTAILIGAAASLFAAALWAFVSQLSEKRKIDWRSPILASAIAFGLIILSYFIGFNIHFSVPNLGYLPLEEAENVVERQHLASVVVPMEKPGVQLGRVVPDSQSLLPGYLVPSGSMISFNISDEGLNSLDYPRANAIVNCIIRKPEGFCTIDVEGNASTLVSSGRLQLLLWAKSRESGWHLQLPHANQTAVFRPDRTWMRQAQIGSLKYPPSDGELVDLALTVITSNNKLVRKKGDQSFAEPQGWLISTAERVSIRLIGGK